VQARAGARTRNRLIGGTAVALTRGGEVNPMLMFKRSQLYIGLALAGLAEIIVRAVAH
jgi:hypothetical protein